MVSVYPRPSLLSISGPPSYPTRQRHHDLDKPTSLESAEHDIQPSSEDHADVLIYHWQYVNNFTFLRSLVNIHQAIYKTEKTPLAAFLDITRGILETMAKYAEEIENMINVNFHGSRDNVPKEMRHTILQYHQVYPILNQFLPYRALF